MGHACPISATRALTSAHVVDPRPFDKDVPLTPLRWSDRLGNAGEATPKGVIADSDLALLDGNFPVVFPLATKAPAEGDKVRMVKFGWRFKFEELQARVVRMVGGMIVFDKDSEGGSSGGCVLNEAGEVVGVVAWGVPDEAGLAVDVTRYSPEQLLRVIEPVPAFSFDIISPPEPEK